MVNLINYIARSLVSEPDEVQVHKNVDDDLDVYELTVGADDLGKVIGRQGRTARAMRAVLRAASAKSDRRSQLEIIE